MTGQGDADAGGEKAVTFVWTVVSYFLKPVVICVAGEYEDMNRKELLLTISNLERVSTPQLSSSKSSSWSISMTRNDQPVFMILIAF